jgi:ATP-dependent DNA helicase RecQ
VSESWTEERLSQELLRHFGHAAFREGQRESVQAVLGGRDVVLVMPTGSGKSLCYQLSALLLPGVTVVISPLIALMKDQVDALERKGIAATYLNSSVDGDEMAYRLDGLRSGRYKLVYVAPERFRNRRFADALAQATVSLFTVDEAHCISQWGHDFRPDYLNLKSVLERLGPVRVLAVTATATPDVRADIVRQLGLGAAPRGEPLVEVTGFARPNLYLAVTRCPTHKHKFARLVQMAEAYRCGIVYCATRKMAERVCAMLQGEGFKPLLYHGAMADAERSAAQERFMSEPSPIVVATNAFGMGVDRGDLRFVAHWDVPGSLEAYYQEVGRAGRDGARAWCELLFNYADVATQRFFLDGANPAFADILAVWEAVHKACASGDVTCAVEEWAKLAGVKNDMEVRTILGLIERARLIEREILPGNRAYTTRLAPNPDLSLAELKRLAAGLDEKRRLDERKLETLLRFVDHPACRHAFLLGYFGEGARGASCEACDRCRRQTPEKRLPPDEAQWLVIQKALSCVARMKGRFGALRVAQVLHGDRDETVARHELDQLSTFGLLADLPVPHIRAVLDALQSEGCLAVSPDEYRLVALSPKGRQVMLRQLEGFALAWPKNGAGAVAGRAGKPASRSARCPDLRDAGRPPLPSIGGPTSVSAAAEEGVPPAAARSGGASEPDHAVALRLQKWVRQMAAIQKVPPYQVLQKATVEAIATARPASFEELEAVKGMGPVKVQRYGRAILDAVAGA